MPCRDYDSDHDSCQRGADELKARADKVTRLLCKVLTSLESSPEPLHRHIDDETLAWWKDHKKKDMEEQERNRKENEYQRKLREWEAQRPKL